MTLSNTTTTIRPLVRDARLSQAAVVLTIALDVGNVVDKATLARFRDAITTQLAAHLDKTETGVWTVELESEVNPPKPLLAAAFSIRIRWSQWFFAISPAGAKVRLTVRDDRPGCSALGPGLVPPPPMATTRTSTTSAAGYTRTASPVPSLGRSSSCSSMRSAVSASTAPTSVSSSADSSPKNPFAELGNGVLDTVNGQQQRRVRRQRGGVKQKQRGIHVDKAKLDVTPYDNGITGVLTGGVMLGRRPRPAGPGPAGNFQPPPYHMSV